MRRTLLFFSFLFFACTTTTSQVSPGGDNPAPDPSTLPEIPADQIGKACSGYGTGIGEAALFTDDKCASGACLVDARTGLDEYCSADCEQYRCPAGWKCDVVNHGATGHACFKDPDAVKPPPPPVAPTSFLDAKLTAYHANQSAKTTIALRDYQDLTRTNRDLVVAIMHGPWSGPSVQMMKELDPKSISRVAFVVVLVDGNGPDVKSTTSDLATFHSSYGVFDVVLDPMLTTLTPLGPLEAVPSYVALDAKSMKEVGRDMGWDKNAFADLVETWRTKAKAIK
jgi:hypothetical protein